MGTKRESGIGSAARASGVAAVCAVAGLLAMLTASAAPASVGVEGVSRHGGSRGDEVKLTVGCGFCYPPCVGPKGERHPQGFDRGPCMLGTQGKQPPASFGISLVPLSKAPEPRPCGQNAFCSPTSPAPPRRGPYTFLGLAVPPPGGNNPEHGDPPRYRLSFVIPDISPGAYAYVIWCDACQAGREGSLISVPASRAWRLVVR